MKLNSFNNNITSHTITPKSYVQDGIYLMLDGEWNGGIGKHINQNPIEIISGKPLSLGTGVVIEDICFNKIKRQRSFSSITCDQYLKDLFTQKQLTIECCRSLIDSINAAYYTWNIGDMIYEQSSGYTTSQNPWISIGPNYTWITRSGQFQNATISVTIDDSSVKCYANGNLITSKSIVRFPSTIINSIDLMEAGMKLFSFRIYNRLLRVDELLNNYEVDKKRFGL